MGISIHYRGTIDDLEQIETMEDRVLDLTFSLGGRATIWRSFANHDRQRAVRGLLIEMEPGHDTFSLLISPEGHLTPVFQIEDAEKAAFDEPPYCFVKTQFGSVQGHVAIVHMLDAIRQKFCSNLEVYDEGEYQETRDVNILRQKMQLLDQANSAMAEGLQEFGLSQEAAEDPSILAARIERIASLVQQKIQAEPRTQSGSAADHAQPSSDHWHEASIEEEVEAIDRLRRQSDLRSERMTRRIAEATASGMSVDEAFELALQEEGLSMPNTNANDSNERLIEESQDQEPWLESLASHPFDEDSRQTLRDNHPAVAQAETFLVDAMELQNDQSDTLSYISVLIRASLDMLGGIVQATSDDFSGITHRALAITQLKRALTGHAYARGAIFGLHSEGKITKEQATEFRNQLESLSTTIQNLSEDAWT